MAKCKACAGTGRVSGKKYLHVKDACEDAPDWARAYQDRAFAHACRVATALGVPAAYFPRPETGALRVLEYPAGAGSAEHTDPDLFTVPIWRETPEDLQIQCAADWQTNGRIEAARAIAPGLHIGELGELVGLGPATPHRVPARPYVQRSIVYFAIPDHASRLPQPCSWEGAHTPRHGHGCGCQVTVGEWIAKRMARSRYEVKL